jgi:SAM-dependent methyltransferase
MRSTILAVLLAAGAAPAVAQHTEPGRYGNPADLDGYIAHLADPARDAWQKPDEVIGALNLRPGQVACDIGSGPGYFTLRLARAVGPAGRVYAVDVEPKILDALRERLAGSGLRNVTPVLGLADNPMLPPAGCDVILIVDTYHHFPDRVSVSRGRFTRLQGTRGEPGWVVGVACVRRQLIGVAGHRLGQRTGNMAAGHRICCSRATECRGCGA